MNISIFRSIAGEYEHLRQVNTVSMMNLISSQIEDQIVGHNLPVDFYAGFQKFSHFPDQMRRYQRLGAVCRRVFVFGIPDTKPPVIPGIEFIPLDATSPLVNEWFLLVETPDFWSILSTQEVGGRDLAGGRKFDGLWSFDSMVTDRASLLLSQMMGQFYRPISQRNYENQNKHISEIMANVMGRLEDEQTRGHRQRLQSSTFLEVAQRMRQEQDVEQFLQSVAQILNLVFGAMGVVIRLWNEQGQMSNIIVEGETEPMEDAHTVDMGPTQQALNQGAPVHVADMRMSRERDMLLATAQALIAVPIVGQQQLHGVITVGAPRPGIWGDDDANTISGLANILSALMDQGNGAAIEPTGQPISGNLEGYEQWQAPITYLITMQTKIRNMGNLTDEQHNLLNQANQLTVALAQAIGVPKEKISRVLQA